MPLAPRNVVLCLLGLAQIMVRAGEQTQSPVSTSDSEILARIHFVGCTNLPGHAQQFVSPTNSSISALAVSRELKQQVLDKLAKAPYALFRQRVAPGSKDFVLLFRPLFEDLINQEWLLEIRGQAGSFPEISFAIELNQARAQLWQSNLSVISSGWTKINVTPIKEPGVEGWELKKHHEPNLWRLIRTGSWLLLGAGQDRLPLQASILERVRNRTHLAEPAPDCWMDLMIDGPSLDPWLSLVFRSRLPKVHLSLQDRGGVLLAKGSLTFPSALGWQPAPWVAPTNLIQGPVMSFAALQCVLPWLEKIKQLEPFRWEPPPQQAYLWTAAGNPMETRLAIPAPAATNIVEQLAPRVASALNTNLMRFSAGNIAWRARDRELVWERVPFIAPNLHAVQDCGAEYLLAGLIRPSTRSVASSPGALPIQDLDNQVYYGWENASANLARWRNLSLLLLPLARRPLMNTDATANRWLDAITPLLGSTTTRLTLEAQNELSLNRQGTLALTGLELVLLANWLETTNFPLGGLEMPARKERTAPSR